MSRRCFSTDRAPLLLARPLLYNLTTMSTLAQTQTSKLDELVRRIVEAVDPLRIILFGSAVRGEMGPDSDLDVLVVMPEGTHRSETAGFLYTRMLGMMVPIDILVATEADLERYRETKGTVYRDIAREGRNIYVASSS
jgi:uncharacterized protein